MNRKADFFLLKNRFESIRITNRIDSNRELECSSAYCAGSADKLNQTQQSKQYVNKLT